MAPISFARGAPSPDCLDPELIADCTVAALSKDGRTILSYGAGGGYAPLREWLGSAPRCRGEPRLRDDRRAPGLRPLRRRAARAPSRARARRGPDLRPAAEDPRPAGRRRHRRADGRRGPRPRRARSRARARPRDLVPLHDPDLPEPVRAHPRHRAAAAARRARHGVRRPGARGRPVRTRAVRGRRASVAARARGRSARHVHVVVLEDGGPRACASATSSSPRTWRRPTTTSPSRRTSPRRSCRRGRCSS